MQNFSELYFYSKHKDDVLEFSMANSRSIHVYIASDRSLFNSPPNSTQKLLAVGGYSRGH